MKIREVYNPKSLTDIMNNLQSTYGRKPREVSPEDKTRADALRVTRDAYRKEVEEIVQGYTADQKEQFFNDVLQKYPDIAKHVDLEHVWMFSPAVKAERSAGLDPADEWKSHAPLPGSNYTGD